MQAVFAVHPVDYGCIKILGTKELARSRSAAANTKLASWLALTASFFAAGLNTRPHERTSGIPA